MADDEADGSSAPVVRRVKRSLHTKHVIGGLDDMLSFSLFFCKRGERDQRARAFTAPPQKKKETREKGETSRSKETDRAGDGRAAERTGLPDQRLRT
jgi:hypothetical protein